VKAGGQVKSLMKTILIDFDLRGRFFARKNVCPGQVFFVARK
jgi:hypothetical protein